MDMTMGTRTESGNKDKQPVRGPQLDQNRQREYRGPSQQGMSQGSNRPSNPPRQRWGDNRTLNFSDSQRPGPSDTRNQENWYGRDV